MSNSPNGSPFSDSTGNFWKWFFIIFGIIVLFRYCTASPEQIYKWHKEAQEEKPKPDGGRWGY